VAQAVHVHPQDELGSHRTGDTGDVAERVEGAVELLDDGVDRRRVGQVAEQVLGRAFRRILDVERRHVMPVGHEALEGGVADTRRRSGEQHSFHDDDLLVG